MLKGTHGRAQPMVGQRGLGIFAFGLGLCVSAMIGVSPVIGVAVLGGTAAIALLLAAPRR